VAVEHEPVSCPLEGCGAPAGTSYPWASDQGAAIALYGKCLGCLHLAGELTEDTKNKILAESTGRGVSPTQAMEQEEVEVAVLILRKLDQLIRGQVAIRLGIGALLRMNTGGKGVLPEEVVRMLGLDPDDAKAEAARSNLAIDIPPGFDPTRLKGPLKH
jgi:hypothetical protein